jgi:hypothetical protein
MASLVQLRKALPVSRELLAEARRKCLEPTRKCFRILSQGGHVKVEVGRCDSRLPRFMTRAQPGIHAICDENPSLRAMKRHDFIPNNRPKRLLSATSPEFVDPHQSRLSGK